MVSRSRMIGTKKMRKTLSKKADLVFPVARIKRLFKKHHGTALFRQSVGGAVYCTAVLEYLAAEVLELAGAAAKTFKRKIISPRCLMLALRQDQELYKLCKDVIIPASGVVPQISDRPVGKLPKSSSTKAGVGLSKKLAKHVKGGKRKTTPLPPLVGGSSYVPAPANPHATAVLNEKTLFLGQKLTVVQGDILDISADAVVHPTNASYFTGGEVGTALANKGGAAFHSEINKLKANQPSLAVGGAAISGAVKVPYKHVIHVNSGSWNTTSAVSTLEDTVKKVLSLCDEKNLKSVAFPSIGSGRAGYPKQVAAETILRGINSYFAGTMQSSVKQVYFVLYDDESVQVYRTELARLV